MYLKHGDWELKYSFLCVILMSCLTYLHIVSLLGNNIYLIAVSHSSFEIFSIIRSNYSEWAMVWKYTSSIKVLLSSDIWVQIVPLSLKFQSNISLLTLINTLRSPRSAPFFKFSHRRDMNMDPCSGDRNDTQP